MLQATLTQGLFGAEHLPRGWSALLERWTEVASHEEWGREKDCGWWYGERASVSQLAGAAWKIVPDGWAMTEYAWKRGIVVDEASRARVDLCCQAMQGELRSVVEAKQVWPRLGVDDARSMVEGALVEAADQLCVGDCSKLARHEQYDHVAAVFAVPTIAIAEVGVLQQRLAGFVSAISRMSGCGGAWVVPGWASQCIVRDRVFPGVALVAKRVLQRTVSIV